MGVPPDALMGHRTDRDCNVRIYSNEDRIVKKKSSPFIARDFTTSPIDMEGLQLIGLDAFVNPDSVENDF